MNHYLKTVLKRYLIILFFVSFTSMIISPDLCFKSFSSFIVSVADIFFYRFHIFSMFSLLFATLATIQSFERQNLNVAYSIAGINSFKLMKPVFLLGLFLSLCGIGFHEVYLPTALEHLDKDGYFSSYSDGLSVMKLSDKTLFAKRDLSNFVCIKNDQIIYAKSAEKTSEGFNLIYADIFAKSGGEYEKSESHISFFLPVNMDEIKEPSQLKISASIRKLTSAYFTNNPRIEIDKTKLLTNIAYRIFVPFLNLFAVFLATLVGFSQRLRREYYLAFGLTLSFSLVVFYFLECSYILSNGQIISPLVFITATLALFSITPTLTYFKKV